MNDLSNVYYTLLQGYKMLAGRVQKLQYEILLFLWRLNESYLIAWKSLS